MNKAVFSVELPADFKDAAARLADLEGISLDEWLVSAIRQRVDAAEGAAAFLQRKSAGASARGLQFYLDRAPDVPPLSGDELPEGWRKGN